MTDNELKEALESIRHEAIRVHLTLDETPIWRMFTCRKKLKTINSELTHLSHRMLELEDAFDENIRIPGAFNGAVMRAAQLSILFSLRSSTNEAINGAKSKVGQIYNDINFYRSLIIALIALVVSIIGIGK